MRRQVVGMMVVVCAVLLMLNSGCAYVHTQRPMDRDFNQTRLGTKVGKSHTRSVLWMVAWGDGGTKAAADDGGIEVIQHADIEIQAVLFGAYTKVSTVVYGD